MRSNLTRRFSIFLILALSIGVADSFLSIDTPSLSLSPSPLKVASRHLYRSHTTARRGVALEPPTDPSSIRVGPEEIDDHPGCTLDDVRRLTRDALLHVNNGVSSTERGLQALEELADLCTQRQPYNFDINQNQNQINSSSSLIAHTPALLPAAVTDAILDRVAVLAQQGLLSTNPDSVDGLPSFHLNLVSSGKAVVVAETAVNAELFQRCLTDLLDLVRPHIYDNLLPAVRQQLNDDSIRVGDVFLRRYGTEVVADQPSRRGISAHYDVLARATSVVALDATAATGRNGLYTSASSSDHAALRRFFPLESGDAVTHTWDVLHGVSVEAGLDRTSLIVWFVATDDSNTNDNDGMQQQQQQQQSDNSSPPRWLTEHRDLESSDVAQFVLGSAMESSNAEDATIVDLYLRSAAQGNTFALTRLGSLMSAAAANDNEMPQSSLDEATWARARELAHRFRNNDDDDRYSALHQRVLGHPRNDDNKDDPLLSPMDLAKTFWLEGAIRGNPLAQMALADELMYESTTENNSNNNDTRRITAAVLFGLAAQQGLDEALDTLARAVQYDVAVGDYASEQDFGQRSLVAQVAQRACCRLE